MGERIKQIINYFTPEGWAAIGIAFTGVVGFVIGVWLYFYLMTLWGWME